jgi:adenylate cyclase
MCHSGCFGALIMNDPPRILVVDDNQTNRDIIVTRLERHGYETFQAADGEEALAAVKQHCPDLVLLDVMMPQLDGIETCRRIKCDVTFPFLPIILVTAKMDSKDIVAGLDAGADEYLTKPVDQAALVARVRSVLRVKALHDQVQAQAAELATWNRTLENRVAEQVAEIERIGRLKRFLSPQVAQLVSSGDERVLESHRREVTVVFCDLRDFTAFAEAAEPEEVIAVLREYHRALGALIDKFEGTVERFAGDGLMVLFNDPLPCAAPWASAVQMAIEMRDEVAKLAASWRTHGHDLGFGIGIAHGYATLGCIGFEGRFQYSATGTVANLASRLCDHALNGQILVDAKVHAEAGALAELESVGELDLKGFRRPVKAFNVRRLRTAWAEPA